MTLPLILLPGMMCDARVFEPQVDVLSVNRPVSVEPVDAHDSIEALATEVLRVAPERFALGGLSMGGIVAMDVARQAPLRVAGLALLDTNPLAESDEMKARRGPQMEQVRKGRLSEVMRDEMKPNYLAEGSRRARVLDLCMDMALGLGPEVFCRQSVALRDRLDQTQTLQRFTGLSLVLCGREDKLCPVARHDLMHSLLPRSTLAVLEAAGHLPCLEQPEKTTEALDHWLKDLENDT